MTKLPKQYEWLTREPGPKMLLEGLKTFGTLEAPGKANNPTILGWAKECGIENVYTNDAIPWCGLWLLVIAKRAGKWLSTEFDGKTVPKPPVKSPLWALSWADFGKLTDQPMLGDVLTFKRQGGGHVGLYVGEDAAAFHVLGGNQSDKVCITRIARPRFYRARRPLYNVQPSNVRRVILNATGVLSKNEQ